MSYSFLRHLGKENVAKNAKGQQMLRTKAVSYDSTLLVGGFMASGAKNQLPLVNDLGAPTLRDGSVGRWDGKESFFPDGFDVGRHP